MRFAFIALLLSQTASMAVAQSTETTEGVWGIKYKRGSESVSVNYTQVDQMAVMDVEAYKWPGLPRGRCRYYLEVMEGTPQAPVLNSAYGEGTTCLESFPISLERTGADQLTMTPQGGLASSIGLPAFEMQPALRPFRPQVDARASIEGFDILGIETRMTRGEVEPILAESGFEMFDESVLTGDGYTMSQQRWGRGELLRGDIPADVLTIQWSAQREGAEQDEVVVIVGRDWEIPESAQLAESTLLSAITDKYGQIYAPRGMIFFDRNGNRVADERSACSANGPHQQISYEMRGGAGAMVGHVNSLIGQISPYCGPMVRALIKGRSNTGRASELHLALLDPDIIWEDFWKRWSTGKAEEMRQIYNGVSNSTGAAPEL